MLDAYGFRFLDLPSSRPPVGDLDDWPTAHIVSRAAEGTGSPDVTVDVRTDSARLRFPSGSVAVDRPSSTITFHHDPPLDEDAIIHPFLTFPAAVLNHWRGRSSLHAGALITDNQRAVVLLGDRGAGKSTTLAAAARREQLVLADDLVVIEGRSTFAGPRCIDLRADASLHLSGRLLGVVDGRERWRIDLPAVPARADVGAIVALTWGSDIAARRLSAAGAAHRLFASFALGCGPGTADHLYDLVRIPMWEVSRPPSFPIMGALLDQINTLC